MRTGLQEITPDQAERWLMSDTNFSNRGLRQHHVEFLAREMSESRWRTTHQGIAFGTNGRLLDGQHRLAAIVRSGLTIEMMVSVDLDPEAFRAMDGGITRANADRIHLVNDQPENRIICIAIREFLVETTTNNKPSVGLIEEEFLKKDEAWMWLGREMIGVNPKLRKAGVLASLGLYRWVKPEKAADFLFGYRNGSGLTTGSPVLCLRDVALTGGADDCRYWKSQAVMRAHLHGRQLTKMVSNEIAEDMMGNQNTGRAHKARLASISVAGKTRWARVREQRAG